MDAVSEINDCLWTYLILPCVVLCGLYLSVRCGFLQLRAGFVLKNTAGKLFAKREAKSGSVTPMQAFSTALAGTAGTGNIVGTAQALAMGGAGAVFWLWVSALLGMIIKYAEVALSVRFRRRDADGDWVGGPMYYIEGGLKHGSLPASLYAGACALSAFGMGCMSQINSISNSVAAAVGTFSRDSENIGLLCGIVAAVLVAAALFGGIKRIGAAAERLIPAASLLYIVMTGTVLVCNLPRLGEVLAGILTAAFTPRAVLGAGSGVAVKQAVVWGLRRSAFSNEAGLGSAGIAHAAAETESPAYQGLFGIFEVFMDTIVLCTMTALAVLVSGVPIVSGETVGAELVASALATVFGAKASSLLVALSLCLFAFTTLLAWSLYGERCVRYLFGDRAARAYRIVFVAAIIIGSVSPIGFVWELSDTLNALMAVPNLAALFGLGGETERLTREMMRGCGGKTLDNGNKS